MSNTNLTTNRFTIFYCIIFLSFFQSINTARAQQVSEVITDFGGFWKSGVGAINPSYPNTGHNMLSFKYNTVVYSTGVDDSKLTANSITYTAGDFRAFPIATVGGTVTSGASIYIALASRYDGIPNGYSNPLPYLKIKDVLIDGVHGLDLGTGATNIPASALINFPISTVISSSISDAKPDIVVSQVASPTSTGDTLYFVDNTGTIVGSKISINWTSINTLGTYYLDLYSLPNGSLCDTAHISGTADKETTREIRLVAFKLSDFGITTGNASNVAGFILKASGTSDPAFIAYNADAFTIPAPVITVQPATQVVCPNVSNSATFSVTATGGSLTYQWKKNNVDIPGATNSTYTISNVTSASAGAYNVVVSNPIGSVVSNTAYLNTSVSVQPSPASQLIATGASCTISVNANNATGYQWKRGNTDISGATSSSYTMTVSSTDTASYSVRIINAAGGGCATITSNAVNVIGSTILYSKNNVNLNLAGSWGVNTDGSGSSPVDFTRQEHTFIVKNNASTGGNLTIAGTLDVANVVTTITGGTTLQARKIIRSGTGSIAGSSTADLTVTDTSNLYFQSGNNTLRNLIIQGGNITLLNALNITGGSSAGAVTLNAGKLNTGDNLIFKSDANGTARLAAITGGGILNGKVTIERFIPAARGWRYLSVPITSTGAPTINEAWQEGVTTASANTNPNPGYGGIITGGTTANGFDQSATNLPSIKVYNNNSGAFVRLPATPGTNIPITDYPAYCVYFRGDRGINPMQGLNTAITSTTLRMKGNLKTGNQATTVNATGYTLIGNPYASAIDFSTITRSNVANTFYVWDPKIAGNYGLGGYVTVSWNSNTNSYDRTSSVSSVSQYIQSGEAFFVGASSHASTGTLTIKEADKTAAGSDLVYRSNSLNRQLRLNLYSSVNDTLSFLDGILTTYADDNQNSVDEDDPVKFWGSNQSICIKRDGKFLAIERRKTITENDTTFLNMYQMKPGDYKMEIIMENMESGNNIATIKDNYNNSTSNLLLNMNAVTFIPFTVNADTGSYSVNRFSIFFEHMRPLPVKFTSVKAVQDKANVNITWNTENETNIDSYDVESSLDAVLFTTIANQVSKGISNSSVTYSSTDINVTNEIHYYRIVSKDKDSKKEYSQVVKVNISSVKNNIIVFPNPVKNTVSFQTNDIAKGNYTIEVFNTSGQLMKTIMLKHEGGKCSYTLTLDNGFPSGKYHLKLSGTNTSIISSFIKE